MKIKWFSFVRITGLVLVLIYHFFKNVFPGGFIGVDVFFTFSGFLITALMIDEFSKKQSFDLVGFYRRRLYRIVPPLVLSILVVMPFTFLIGKDFITMLGKQIIAALGFVTNLFEIALGGSYENKFIPHLFVHTWSLAVEVHFYIIWALVAFAIAFLAKRQAPDKPQNQAIIFRTGLCAAAAVFGLIGFLSMFIRALGMKEYSGIYFSSIAHSFPFFIGAIAATFSGVKNIPKKFSKVVKSWSMTKALAVLGGGFVLLFILSILLKFDSKFTYLFGLLIASLIAVAMILAARILHEKTPDFDEPKAVSFLADTSYGVYLFHWPLYIIFTHRFGNVFGVILTLLFSYGLAVFSYYILEPLIAGKKVTVFANEISWEIIKLPSLITVGVLCLMMGIQMIRAPKISSLEKDLWTASLYQDADNLQLTRSMVDNLGTTEFNIPKGVSVIGDSVTLGTRAYLSEHLPDSWVDAEGNRTLDIACEVMAEQQEKGTLRENVVICVGTNCLDGYEEHVQAIIETLGVGHRLIFMTPYDGSADATYNSTKLVAFERELPKQYKFVTIADWNQLAPAHPEIFEGTDGTHFGGVAAGDELYAQCIADALVEAEKTPVKNSN